MRHYSLIGVAIPGAAEEAEFMEENYKGHDITASAWQITDTQRWQPKLAIIWREGSNEAIKYPVITKYFSTRVEAEREGLAFAKKWIDDGKPNF